MAIHYSASAGAFFNDAHHATIPDDAVTISAARHRTLLEGQATGSSIFAGDDGRPRLQRRVQSLDDRRADMVRAVKKEAARRIAAISPLWRQLNDIRDPAGSDAQARFAKIDAIRAASNAIETEVNAARDLGSIAIATHPAWGTI